MNTPSYIKNIHQVLLSIKKKIKKTDYRLLKKSSSEINELVLLRNSCLFVLNIVTLGPTNVSKQPQRIIQT